MKKLATVIAAVTTLAFAAPVFACPHADKKAVEKTAENKDEKAKPDTAATAKKTDKAPAAKTAPVAKTADAGKVSIK